MPNASFYPLRVLTELKCSKHLSNELDSPSLPAMGNEHGSQMSLPIHGPDFAHYLEANPCNHE